MFKTPKIRDDSLSKAKVSKKAPTYIEKKRYAILLLRSLSIQQILYLLTIFINQKEEGDYKDGRRKEVIENSCKLANIRKKSSVLKARSILSPFYLFVIHSQPYSKKANKAPKMKNDRQYCSHPAEVLSARLNPVAYFQYCEYRARRNSNRHRRGVIQLS